MRRSSEREKLNQVSLSPSGGQDWLVCDGVGGEGEG